MLGLNWIDIIIFGLLGLSIYLGAKIGFLTQFLTVGAIVAALFASGWLFPKILPFDNQNLRTILNTALVLTATAYAGLRGFDLGQKIHWSFRFGNLRRLPLPKQLEMYAGALPAVIGTLLVVWLLGVGISRLPFEGFSNSVSDSIVVQHLARALPSVPSVFAEFDEEIDPNDQPDIAARTKPYKNFNYSEADFKAASAKASDSVVRITSFGCGGVVSGSGFYVGHNLVMTNAHVIAGVRRPIVKTGDDSIGGVPVIFNPGLDFAVLKLRDIGLPALQFVSTPPATDTTVAVLGYPGGNFKASPGILRDNLSVSGSNIYQTGTFKRQAYGIQAQTDKGDSGGPVTLKDGTVAGMVFSKAADTPDYAYALPASYLKNALDKAGASNQRVSTGACVKN